MRSTLDGDPEGRRTTGKTRRAPGASTTAAQEAARNRGEGVRRLAEATLPSRFGHFRIAVYAVDGTPGESVALIQGKVRGVGPVLVRLHSECLTGDALGSLRCDCGEQLDTALRRIGEAGHGVLLYLPQEGRGIGLANKIRAYALQDSGLDTVDANTALGLPVDGREYGAAAAILQHLGISEVRLLSNNPAKLRALEQHGVRVVERVPLEVRANANNVRYLHSKATRMGHLLACGAEGLVTSVLDESQESGARGGTA